MSDRDPIGTDADKALWAQLKAGARTSSTAAMPPVSDMELAAWLDGRLAADAMSRIEARLAADPVLLDAALETADTARTAEPAPDRLVTRAQALVGFEAEQKRPSRGSFGWLGRWRRSFEMALVASAFLVVCATGFSLGGGFQEAYAGSRFDIADVVGLPSADNGLSFLGELGDQ
jgi:hypothetical protein